MDSTITGPPEKLLGDFDPSCMGTEDCQYILRALEKRAFEYVVIALRAQGPLSQYKEVILDHLKSIFFISDDDFLLRLRLAANDPYLSKIAQELNPSYDNVGDWLSAGYSLVSLEFPHAIQTGNAPNHAASMLSKEMQEEMSRHNSYLSDEKEALLKLLQLSKKPYVPEKLRRLLQDTEKDVHGRADLAKEKTSITKHRQVGRPRRAESVGASTVDLDLSKNKTTTASSKAEDAYDNNTAAIEASRLQAANHLTLLANTSLELSSNNTQKAIPVKHEEADNHSHKAHGEFSIHYAAGANVVVVDPEDQNTTKEPKIRKRRTKVVDDATWVCARVQPFIFERAPAGQAKVPRGNPDKRTTKRATQATQQQQASAVSYSGGGELAGNTYPQSSSNSNYYAGKNITYIGNMGTVVGDDLHVLPKRNRTSSVGEEMSEDGRILHAYQKTQSTNRPMMSSNSLPARSSYYTGDTLVVTSLNRNNYGAVPQQQYEGGASTLLTSNSGKPPPATTIIVTEAANSIASGRYVGDEMYMESGGEASAPVIAQEIVSSLAATFVGEVQLVDSSNGMVIGTVMNQHNDHVVDHHNYSQQLLAPPHKVPPVSITTSSSNDSSAAAASGLVALHNHRQQMSPMVTVEKQQPQPQHFGGGPSGLDFLASTASLLTPMQKSQHHHGQSLSHQPLPSSSSSAPPQHFSQHPHQQGPSTTSLSSSTTTTVMVVTSGPPPAASTTAMTGPRPVSNLSTYSSASTVSHHRQMADSTVTQYVPKTAAPSVTLYPPEKLPSVAYQHQPAYFVGQAEQHQSTSTMVYHHQQAPTGSSSMCVENSASGCQKPLTSTLSSKNSHQTTPSVKGEIAVTTSLAVQKRFPIKYVTKAAPASAASAAAIGDIRFSHQKKQQSSSGIGSICGYTSAPSPTLANSSSPSTSSSTAASIPPTSTKNFDHQATQEFLKQHAADNNGVLNEEVTLGSILRSKTTNLRNKLLSAAVVGKSVVVSSTSSASSPNLSGSLPSSPSSSTAPTAVPLSTAAAECFANPDTTGSWINENVIAGEAGGCGGGRLPMTTAEATAVTTPSASLQPTVPPQKLVNLPSESGECTEFVTKETTSHQYVLSKEEM